MDDDLKQTLKNLFGIDFRSLALFRIALGFLLLSDSYLRSFDIRAFYTDFGSLPRISLIEQFSDTWYFSLHLINGRVEFQAFLLFCSAIAAVCLIAGYRTRLFTVISWILLTSLHNRNPYIINVGNYFFRMLLFWGMFLPLGGVYSVDSLRCSQDREKGECLSVASVALWIQIAIVYLFAVYYRSGPDWHASGTAIYYALSSDQMAKPLGHWLLNFPNLLKLLTLLVYWFEAIGPLLLLFPFLVIPGKAVRVVRMIVVFLFIFFHLGLFFTMDAGLFEWICVAAMTVFLPGLFWEKAERYRPKFFGASWVKIKSRIQGLRATFSGSHATSRGLFIASNGAAFFFLVYILLWNFSTISPNVRVPKSLMFIASIFRLDQKWDMFAHPITTDGWYVMPGKLRDGREVDLWKQGRPVVWQKPDSFYKMYKNEFWQKFMMVFSGNFVTRERRLLFAQYLCRDWNASHAEEKDKLQSFEIYFMAQKIRPGQEKEPPVKNLMWKHYCFKVPEVVPAKTADEIQK